MQKNVKVAFWTLLLCVGGFLFAGGIRSMLPDHQGILLTLSPEELEFPTAFSEGTEFQAEFIIENKTRSNLLINRLAPSCGCTSLSTKDGLPIEVPFVLSPSSPFPVQIVVDTKGIVGKRNEAILVQYEHRGRSFAAVGTVVFDVAPTPNPSVDKFGK